jgi:putative transcriptional regulator
MNPIHHPPDDHLLALVSGQISPTLRALLECHLHFCDSCASTLAELSQAGGRLLAEGPGGPLPETLFEAVLARLPDPPRDPGFPVPTPLWSVLRPAVGANWRGLFKTGIRFLYLEGGLTLVHAKPGIRFPAHTHEGTEESLILAGGLRDLGETYEKGDYQIRQEGIAHAPVALEDEDCWLVTAGEDTIRFKGWRSWFQEKK